ncbi:MAG: hypothetical protein P8J50_04620 [Acidimicrobiales bacterium]|jgi:hypothetical protein|nr:hypothetical protein [Acidimicrobiales bacterium]
MDLADDGTRFEQFVLDVVATVDGRPTALIQVRYGFAGPNNTFKEIRLVDLASRETIMLSSGPGWEMGVHVGFLADGAIVLDFASFVERRIDVIDYAGNPAWSAVVNDEPIDSSGVRGCGVARSSVWASQCRSTWSSASSSQSEASRKE